MALIVYDEIQQANNGSFPILDSNNIKGGVYSVSTIEERDAIPAERRKLGMLCYVENEDEYYKLEPKGWEEAKFGGEGIPMYDQEIFEQLQNKGELPEKYITIPNKSQDLNVTALSREIPNTGTYVDILFSAIRSLQHEVAKLKNTFNYGIESYTGTNTASNRVISETEAESEPLWAIDPESLSGLEDLAINISNAHKLTPITAYEKHEDEEFIEIKEECSALVDTSDIEESTICSYIRLNPTAADWKIELTVVTEDQEESQIRLTGNQQYSNILIVVKRNSWNDDEEPIGNNFVWVQFLNEHKNVLQQGYYNDGELVTSLIETPRYNLKKISFNKVNLYQCSFYTKESAFSSDGDSIIGFQPVTDDFTFKAAHLTIRSIESKSKLDQVKDRLLNNELIWVENTSRLYIKSNYKIVAVGSGSISDDEEENEEIMDTEQLTQWLIDTGLVEKSGNDYTLKSEKLNPFKGITFIHEGSNKTFDVAIDAEGNLKGTERHNLTPMVENSEAPVLTERGAVGFYQLGSKYKTTTGEDLSGITNNVAFAKGDRLRISSWYCPINNQIKFNCSHDFIELTNCSTYDIPLDDIKLHIVKNLALKTPIEDSYFPLAPNENPILYSFQLKGVISAGCTYTIRGAQRLSLESSQAYVKVDSYDYELWVDNELLDLTDTQAIVLLHRQSDFGNDIVNLRKYKLFEPHTSSSYFTYTTNKHLVDVVLLGQEVLQTVKDTSSALWAAQAYDVYENTITKDQYFLDPAKQAFRSLTSVKETSNCRLQKVAAEYIPLDDEYITFPHSLQKIHVSKYGPKASNKYKNVCSDKTDLDQNKPNFVQCSFGINASTTRCFNWVSAGNQDEYLWIREKGSNTWKRFESYKTNESVPSSDTYPRKKVFDTRIINSVYARIRGTFPANGTSYTSHKLILDIVNSPLSTGKKVYEYIVGRTQRDGNPNLEHCSSIKTFTLYSSEYTPKIFQTTDQQGFGWMEYQVWSAAAEAIYVKIKEECTEENKCFPVCINTGDMTQNGTRVNEWLDYYLGMEKIASEYEQMNVIGNNDLANAYSPNFLGTGDDSGKSSPYYYNIFHCYEVENNYFDEPQSNWNHPVIYNNIYVPSTYYFYFNDYGYLMLNSEITVTTGSLYFHTSSKTNLYTGKYADESGNNLLSSTYALKDTITNMLQTPLKDKKVIVACHEMPLTVITQDYLISNTEAEIVARKKADRCVQNTWTASSSTAKASSLIGSHMNRIHYEGLWDNDDNYWFSKLLEAEGVKLCIGGHKHTYCCTYPVEEFNTSYGHAIDQDLHISKQIIIEREGNKDGGKKINVNSSNYDWNTQEHLNNGVVYFMCQATGYKIKSNKELPSPYQAFSKIVPDTTYPKGKAKAAVSQEYPMYAVITYGDSIYYIDLYRVSGIKKETIEDNGKCKMSKDFSQIYYSTDSMYSEKLLCYKQDESSITYNKVWLTDPEINTLYKQDVDRCYFEGGILKSRNSEITGTFINQNHTNEVTY